MASDRRAQTPPQELVRLFLRGQNLEQVRRVDEAAQMYEEAVASGFDAAGPYDRLIAIYSGRGAHAEVKRVAAAALENVRTFDEKREFYERLRREAEDALSSRPDPTGPEF